MNIEKIKNFSQDEQKTLNYFELIRNEIVERDNELNEGIDFIFGRKFAAKIDLLLNLVITLEEDKEKLQKENEELKETYKSEKKMKNEYVKLYQDLLLKENVITVQKIKDKIEEYKNMLKTCNKVKDIDRIKAINERILELEELLEGRE